MAICVGALCLCRHLAELQKLKDQQQATRSQRKNKLMDKLRRRQARHNLELPDSFDADAEATLNEQVSLHSQLLFFLRS